MGPAKCLYTPERQIRNIDKVYGMIAIEVCRPEPNKHTLRASVNLWHQCYLAVALCYILLINACCIVLRSGATRSTSWRVLGPAFRLRIPASSLSAVGRAGPPGLAPDRRLATAVWWGHQHLRGILLQHSVLLRRRFLCHAIWGDPLFATPEYAEFAEWLVTGLIDGEEPHLIQIERANLLVAGELQTLGRTVASAETSIRLKITRQQRSVVAALEEQKQIVENLSRRLNRRLYINDWFYERIQKAESRPRAAGLALPAITDSDLDPRRPTAPAEPSSGSGTPESADPPRLWNGSDPRDRDGPVARMVGWVGRAAVHLISRRYWGLPIEAG